LVPLGPNAKVDLRSFARAVLPVLLAEAALGLAQALFWDEGDLSLFDWILLVGSFIAFPVWAGARVARAGGLRRWSALGGVCVLLGTVVATAIVELLRPSPPDAWGLVFFGLLLIIPLLALLGFLGGVMVKARIKHGA
jgi:hypothetical protein